MILAVKKLSLAKVADAAGTVSGLISLVLLVTLVTLGFTKQGLEHKFSMINTTYGELEMSTDQNLVLLVLDTVDGDIMSQVIEQHPEYKETLSDFTYYNNTMSAYPFTVYSVPYLFSGEWYEDQEEFIEYAKRVYREAPFFDYLEAYTRLLDGKQGDAIFDYKEGDARERRFLFYDYDEPTHFYEYMQTGYAGDVDTMYFTGVEITP